MRWDAGCTKRVFLTPHIFRRIGVTNSYLREFQPPPRILLGPGPSSVHPRVLQAMTLPLLGHLDPMFFQVMDEVCEMLRAVYNTSNFMTMPLC